MSLYVVCYYLNKKKDNYMYCLLDKKQIDDLAKSGKGDKFKILGYCNIQ